MQKTDFIYLDYLRFTLFTSPFLKNTHPAPGAVFFVDSGDIFSAVQVLVGWFWVLFDRKKFNASGVASSAARAFSATGPAAEDDYFGKLRSFGSREP